MGRGSGTLDLQRDFHMLPSAGSSCLHHIPSASGTSLPSCPGLGKGSSVACGMAMSASVCDLQNNGH